MLLLPRYRQARCDGVELAVKCGDANERITGSHLLIAAGRSPRVEGLALEEAKVGFTPAGIVVDGSLQTTNRRVYATGDAAAGSMRFTHVANYHAGLEIRHAVLRLPAKARYNAVPWVTFTDPEITHVGLTDEQARDQGYRICVMRWPYCENDRAQAERATDGHVKVVTNARASVLGATIVGAHAVRRGRSPSVRVSISAPWPKWWSLIRFSVRSTNAPR